MRREFKEKERKVDNKLSSICNISIKMACGVPDCHNEILYQSNKHRKRLEFILLNVFLKTGKLIDANDFRNIFLTDK